MRGGAGGGMSLLEVVAEVHLSRLDISGLGISVFVRGSVQARGLEFGTGLGGG